MSARAGVIVLALLAICFAAAYALDRGVYIGSERRVLSYPHDPNGVLIMTRCRYLFVTGISEIDASGQVPLVTPSPSVDRKGFLAVAGEPDNSYCRLFAEKNSN